MTKRILSLAFILCTFRLLAAEGDAVLDFRNVYWGVHRDSCYRNGTKVKFVEDKNSLLRNAYAIPGDDKFIGAVKCDDILYLFNDENRFYKVYIKGDDEDIEQMKFILTYKFGDPKNEIFIDDRHIYEWLVKDVRFTLTHVIKSRFELTIESNWQATENYKKNTSVTDF
ncbi:MAG: hypothetical protein NZM35_08295 [Chitinophagales bacterium]|nr:hypothetical protein [Chitinophagales bacterium]MDW8418886.1 hypothetical protein [Chitinophagales bacterium]